MADEQVGQPDTVAAYLRHGLNDLAGDEVEATRTGGEDYFFLKPGHMCALQNSVNAALSRPL